MLKGKAGPMTSQYHLNTVTTFLRRLVFAQKVVSRISLSHQSGRTSSSVCEWEAYEEEPVWTILKNGGVPFEEFATAILDTASTDADAMVGIQNYSLSAYDENARQLGRIPLRFEGGIEGDGSPGAGASFNGSEPPTLAGVVGQLMRHNEAQMRIILQQANAISSQGAKALELLQSQSMSDVENKIQMLTAVQEMLDMKSSREREDKALAASEERKDLVLNKVIGMLPAVAARLTKGVIPVDRKDQPLHQMLQKLLGTFTPEQFEKMQTVLTHDQMLAFGELALSLQSENAEEEKKAAT